MITMIEPRKTDGFSDPVVVIGENGKYEVSGECAAANGAITVGMVAYTGKQGKGGTRYTTGAGKTKKTIVGYAKAATINTSFNFEGVKLSELLDIAAKKLSTQLDIDKGVEDVLSVRVMLDNAGKGGGGKTDAEKAMAAQLPIAELCMKLAMNNPQLVKAFYDEFNVETDKAKRDAIMAKYNAM